MNTWFQNLKVQYKLLLSNLLMIVIPLITLFLLVGGIWSLLRFSNPIEQRSWMMLAPSTIQSQILQFELEQINKKLLSKDTTVFSLRNNTSVIEAQGVDVVIMKDDTVLYMTPDSDGDHIVSTIKKIGLITDNDSRYYEWDGDRLTYVNRYGDGILVIGVGHIPFMAKSMGHETDEKVLVEFLFGLALALVAASAVFGGIYIANRLSKQILLPLQYLQRAAIDIKKGVTPSLIKVTYHDELGETCGAFNNMQRSLAREKQLREEYEEKRRQMIAGICHDIATPLTSVKGYASGILDGVARTPEKQTHYVQMIYTMASNIEKLVSMLSDFSKLELGQIVYDYRPVSLNRVISEYIERHKGDFVDKGIILVESYGESDGLVRTDVKQFVRILDNIFSNSWKYRSTEPLKINVSTVYQNDRVRLTITDNGVGVPEASLNQLFDIFFRTDEARSEVANGNGIGLAIVKQIVMDMGGEIWAERGLNGFGLSIIMEFPIMTDLEEA